MRTQIIPNISKITYPDICCFAYNKQFVTVESENIRYVVVRVTDVRQPSRYFDLGAVLFSGRADIDISSSLAAISDNYIDKRWSYVHIAVLANNVAIASFHTYAICGGIDLARYFNACGDMVATQSNTYFSRSAVWFKKFPFSVSIFTRNTTDPIRCSIDGKPFRSIAHSRILSDVSSVNFYDANKSILIDGGKVAGTYKMFDSTFDKTFTDKYGAEIKEVVNVKVSNATEGIYLRWIDECGYLQYYLFVPNEVELRNTNSGYNKNVNEYPEASKPISTTLKKNITCAAVLIDDKILHYVTSIANAPVVDMYVNEKWQPVHITKTSNVKSKQVLHEYEVTIQFDINLQTLL